MNAQNNELARLPFAGNPGSLNNEALDTRGEELGLLDFEHTRSATIRVHFAAHATHLP